MIKLLQPTISPTGIRYILDNEGRQIATVSALLDGIDNTARAKEAEYIHNAICESFNNAATLRAQNAELREALAQLIKRASQIDDRLLAATGNTADCEIGEITRARAILAKYGDDNE